MRQWISRGRRHRLLLALFIVAALFGAVLLLHESAERPSEIMAVLDRGLATEPESLDPHKARSKQAGDVLRDIGEGLTGYAEDGRLIPAAAKSWEVSEDGLSYRFVLRDDAQWSTGDPVIAAHYVYAFRRLVDPSTASFYAEWLSDIENASAITAGELPVESLGVEALSDHELQIRLARPVPYFLGLLSFPAAFPVHPPSIEAFGDAYSRPGNLPSNGAYTLKEWVIGSILVLTRNDYYWNAANTDIDVVRHHVITEPAAELNRYRAGELDITTNVPPDAFAALRKERPDELRVAPSLGVYYYGFNLTKPPFKDNPQLRMALSMAIDREELTENVIGRGETPAYSWVPPGVDNYESMHFSYAKLPSEERHAMARRLYREAGYAEDGPAQIELRYNTADTTERIALAIQAMWRDVLGFDAKLVNEEFQVLLSNIRAMEITQVFRSSWMGDYNDASAFLYMFHSESASNMFGYRSEEIDALLEQASQQTDMARRQLFLEEVERVVLAEHPVIPIYFFVSKRLVSPRVIGWADNVLDYHYSQHLSLAADP